MHILHTVLYTFPMVEMENFKMWVSVLSLWSFTLFSEIFLLSHFNVNSMGKGSQFWKQTRASELQLTRVGFSLLLKQNKILRKKPDCMIISKMKSYCSCFISKLVRLPSTFSIFDKVTRNNIVWLVSVILSHGV